MKNKFASLLSVAVLCGTTLAVVAKESDEEKVSMAKVPMAVQNALKNYATVKEVKKIEFSQEDNTPVYEFKIKQAKQKFELSFSPTGDYLAREEKVDVKELPAAALSALKAEADKGKVKKAEKNTDKNQKVTYEAKVKISGKKFELTVDDQGKVIRKEAEEEDKD